MLGHAFLPTFPGEDGLPLAQHLSSLSREQPLRAIEHTGWWWPGGRCAGSSGRRGPFMTARVASPSFSPWGATLPNRAPPVRG
ncbi:hypothetical protein DFAR_2690035 [Desulfarculales bacterium]